VAGVQILNREISMKSLSVFACVCLALLPATSCLAGAVEKQACNVDVDVTDTDPRGTHVRATPGGAVIASLKNLTQDGWIGVHITGQLGDWYEIDRASLIGADLPPDGKTIFHARGYLHKSVLGVSGMQNGGAIYLDHDVGSSALDLYAPGDQPVELQGCWGEFLKVHVKKGTGWTKQVCTNMNTTCA
jgi:hypothetical protein